MWIEGYHLHTWRDCLRQRNRPTQAERVLEGRVIKSVGPAKVRMRRTSKRSL